jgi:AraC-like DNA-binding protein
MIENGQNESWLRAEWRQFASIPTVFSAERRIPGSWQYTISRHQRDVYLQVNEQAILYYNYHDEPVQRFLELSFCIIGQAYCQQAHVNCESCQLEKNSRCLEQRDSVDLITFRFEPIHLTNFLRGEEMDAETDAILHFRHQHTFSRPFQITGNIRSTLESILNNSYSDTIENIFINAQTQILLLYCLESMNTLREDEVPACKFLSYMEEREKIIRARAILLEHIGDPITIKELSRKVAINECYLKKGFKVMFGTTIFDFYQDQRMEHARYLLYEKGMTVSEVSAQLGYSSISHFSTAFKKHTGLKPCELLRG